MDANDKIRKIEVLKKLSVSLVVQIKPNDCFKLLYSFNGLWLCGTGHLMFWPMVIIILSYLMQK